MATSKSSGMLTHSDAKEWLLTPGPLTTPDVVRAAMLGSLVPKGGKFTRYETNCRVLVDAMRAAEAASQKSATQSAY